MAEHAHTHTAQAPGCPWSDCRAPAAEISAGCCNVCARAPGAHPGVYGPVQDEEDRLWLAGQGVAALTAMTGRRHVTTALRRLHPAPLYRRAKAAVETFCRRSAVIRQLRDHARIYCSLRRNRYQVHAWSGRVWHLRRILPGIGAWCEHHASPVPARAFIRWMRLIHHYHPFDDRYKHVETGHRRPSALVLTEEQIDEALPF